MERRWSRHVQEAFRNRGKGCEYFWNAIRKYGKDAFSHEVLETCPTVEEANLAEDRWIEELQTRDPKKGFNLLRGGAHRPHDVNNAYRSDPEYLKAQSEAAKERWRDPSYRLAVTSATSSAIRTDEVRKKLSNGVRRAWEDPEIRDRFESAARASASDPAVREKLRSRWDDPAFRTRCSVGTSARVESERAKTHCKRGHELTPENTVTGSRGTRECRACGYGRKRAARTHCPKGHPYRADSPVSSSGRRVCPACLAASRGPRPCSKCGASKSRRSGGRLRCGPCTDARTAAWKASRV